MMMGGAEMKHVEIAEARRLGERVGAEAVIVITGSAATGDCTWTSWGRTKAICRRLAREGDDLHPLLEVIMDRALETGDE